MTAKRLSVRNPHGSGRHRSQLSRAEARNPNRGIQSRDPAMMAAVALVFISALGCQHEAPRAVDTTTPAQAAENTETAPAEAAAKKELVWIQIDIQEGDFTLSLGHRGDSFRAGDKIEPAVRISKDNDPVASAVIHNSLISDDGKTVLAEEQATVFQSKTEEESAHYGTGVLVVPDDTKGFRIRFRIQMPDADSESIYDIDCNVAG